jgi:hypothetical protein
MPDYSIFGGCLRSDIVFPELRTASGVPVTWTLEAATTSPNLPDDAECLGDLEVISGCRVMLHRHARGMRLSYDDTGTFDISADGGRIVWCRGPNATAGAVRADVTGRVLAAALHAAGRLCLHGSAVSLANGTVAFLAPKYHGKSTLALALARAGGRLVTDDVLPVDPGPPARAIPGVHQVKLWGDTAELFGVAGRAPEPGEKHLVHEFADELLMFRSTPLVAIYLLGLAEADALDGEPARRTRLADVPSALALVRHSALGELMGGSQAPVLFDRAVALARTVPVYRLERVGGLDRVHDVVQRLMQWHGTEAAERAAAPALL